jgi:hypothetical protein
VITQTSFHHGSHSERLMTASKVVVHVTLSRCDCPALLRAFVSRAKVGAYSSPCDDSDVRPRWRCADFKTHYRNRTCRENECYRSVPKA